ncbi:cytoplasmic protein NCK2-like, partial [Brachyhypopomus gauderio]|uniref:cytoplasmic protein NCK2-like n=1 Tax=Brachyhypopomus gauderio TaxID=698409 RepID=UPI0040425197
EERGGGGGHEGKLLCHDRAVGAAALIRVCVCVYVCVCVFVCVCACVCLCVCVRVVTGLGKTKRKTSARDVSPTPSTEAELPSNGGEERFYDLSAPAVVKFSYAAEREDELSLVKDARVLVTEKCSDGWWRGVSGGRAGWFPSNYVQEDQEDEAGGGGATDPPALRPVPPDGSRVLQVVQTLYPFSSATDEELNFERGELMEVLEKPENDPEWWRCCDRHGRVGLVPKNYVTVLGDGPSGGGSGGGPLPPRPASPAHTGMFAGKDWYYGAVTRHQAECALSERGVDGDFLVRDSESSPSDFSISLKAMKNKHFKVQCRQGVYCIGQRHFSTMEQLLDHYKKAPIFTSEHGQKLYLVRPLP